MSECDGRAIEASGLVKSFAGRPPVRALDGVDLDVEAGSTVAVLGPSGCGKTTLLRILAGFERPDAGTVTIGGRSVATGNIHIPPERRNVGIVAQEGALFPHLDVAGNIGFGLTGMPRRERGRRIAELLELVGLAGHQRRRPHELSGGQQQRVAVARALAPGPAIILLDEPFAALDTGLRASLRDDVAGVLATTGATAVLVTHDQTEALTMSDTVAVMRHGRIVQQATPEALYRRPVDLTTARFTGDVVVLPGRLRGGVVTCALGALPADADSSSEDGDVTLMLRPEQIVIDPQGATSATVGAIRYEGHDALVHLHVDHHAMLARWSAVELPALDDVVAVAVKGTATIYRRVADEAV